MDDIITFLTSRGGIWDHENGQWRKLDPYPINIS